jgi:hypothetical protein
LRPFVERNLVAFTVIAGLAIAGIAIGFAEATGQMVYRRPLLGPSRARTLGEPLSQLDDRSIGAPGAP